MSGPSYCLLLLCWTFVWVGAAERCENNIARARSSSRMPNCPAWMTGKTSVSSSVEVSTFSSGPKHAADPKREVSWNVDSIRPALASVLCGCV